MDTIIMVRGLTRRWIFNVLIVVFVVIVISELALGFFVKNYYYDSVDTSLYSSCMSTFTSYFGRYTSATPSEFELAAKEFAENFEDKGKMEVQVYDRDGRLIVSTSGYTQPDLEHVDFSAARQSEDGTARWIGKSPMGEKLMTWTMVLQPSDSQVSAGILRFVVSLEDVDGEILVNILTLVGVGVLILLLVSLSGLFFIKSITSPIREITETANRIAAGNFDVRLAVREADEIGKLCDTINYMASELKSAENMKNEFISSISHELRTPLTVIKGWGETVDMSAETDPALVHKGLSVIINESERLSGLVEDLLDFSRMQSGHFTFHMEKIDLLAELGEAVYLYEDAARQRGIDLIYVEPKSLPPVMGDPDRLRQVFINIIDNALKYTQKGGQVLVEAAQQDVYIEVTVKDTGCGIAAEDLQKVKAKFYKANKDVRGSGIGLAVADEIIKYHKGILEVDSKEGVGTTVSIFLPFVS